MSLFKEALRYYKEIKAEDKAKKKLLNKNMDVSFLEKIIQKCNDNPNLKVEVFLKSGDRILLKSYEEKKNVSSMINGVDYEDIR